MLGDDKPFDGVAVAVEDVARPPQSRLTFGGVRPVDLALFEGQPSTPPFRDSADPWRTGRRREEPVDPVSPLAQWSAGEPVGAEGGGEAQAVVSPSARRQVLEGGPDVRQLP